MLRALVALLLIVNVLFFGWAQGWLAPHWPAPRSSEREPERLAAQYRPELVNVLAPSAASAAVRAARESAVACLVAGPFSGALIGAAETALAPAAAASGSWLRDTVQPPDTWIVFGGRFRDAAALLAREAELRRHKLAFEVLSEPPDLAPGLVLSSHQARATADAALKALPAALRGASVVALAPAPAQHWLRAPRADAALQARLRALADPALGAGFRPCPARVAAALLSASAPASAVPR